MNTDKNPRGMFLFPSVFICVHLRPTLPPPCLRGESLLLERPEREPAVLSFLENAFGVLGGGFGRAFRAEAAGSEGVECSFDADLELVDLTQQAIHPG